MKLVIIVVVLLFTLTGCKDIVCQITNSCHDEQQPSQDRFDPNRGK